MRVAGFCSGAVEISVLLIHGTESLDDRFSTFRDSLVVTSSRVECPLLNFYWIVDPLKMTPLCHLDTSSSYHLVTWRDAIFAEQLRLQQYRCKSLKSHIICLNTGSFKKIRTSSTLATEVTGPDTL